MPRLSSSSIISRDHHLSSSISKDRMRLLSSSSIRLRRGRMLLLRLLDISSHLNNNMLTVILTVHLLSIINSSTNSSISRRRDRMRPLRDRVVRVDRRRVLVSQQLRTRLRLHQGVRVGRRRLHLEDRVRRRGLLL